MESGATGAKRGPKPRPHLRENLIKAGMRVLHETGYAATGIQDIVNAASVPKGSFYNHFESKEAFGKEVIDYYFNSGFPDIQALLENKDFKPIDRLKAYFDQRALDFQATDFVHGCLMGNFSLEIADHSVAIREAIAEHFKTWGKAFEACIAEAQQSGAISCCIAPDVLAHFVLNSWEGALLRMRVEKSARPLDEFREVVFATLLI